MLLALHIITLNKDVCRVAIEQITSNLVIFYQLVSASSTGPKPSALQVLLDYQSWRGIRSRLLPTAISFLLVESRERWQRESRLQQLPSP
jgi:hypothetical protein